LKIVSRNTFIRRNIPGAETDVLLMFRNISMNLKSKASDELKTKAENKMKG